MAEIEHPERYSWWLNELDSLGVNTLEKHGLNNLCINFSRTAIDKKYICSICILSMSNNYQNP
jgi:hypothetical protein